MGGLARRVSYIKAFKQRSNTEVPTLLVDAGNLFSDDRFSAAFERKSDDASVFTVAYVVRAVSPGRYVLPQAKVEDMYRPDRFGRTATGTIEISPK